MSLGGWPTDAWTAALEPPQETGGPPARTTRERPADRTREIAACCSSLYGHPAAVWLLGESFHPGGLALTQRVAALAGVDSRSRVLDVGSGRGTTAVHLAEAFGCRVVGLTIEEVGVRAGRKLAAERGVSDRVTFVEGDAVDADLGVAAYDVVLMECVLSILPEKPMVMERIGTALVPGGRLALTDVHVEGPIPAEYEGVLSVAGCVGDARPLGSYVSLAVGAGLHIRDAQDLPDVATQTVADLKGKLMLAEVAMRLGKLPIDEAVVRRGKGLISGIQGLVAQGTVGYCMVVAQRP